MTSQPGMTLWSVRANIVQKRPYGPLGLDQKPGTRHFRAGTKVWAIDAFRGIADSVVVVGPHRGSARYVKMVVHISALDQLRAAVIYSPAVIRMVSEHYGTVPYPFDGDSAREFARMLTGWRTAQEPQPMRALFRVVGPREGDVLRLQPLSAYADQLPLVDVPVRFVAPPLRTPGTTIVYVRTATDEVTISESGDVPFSGEAD